jgi:hypothetical protein
MNAVLIDRNGIYDYPDEQIATFEELKNYI